MARQLLLEGTFGKSRLLVIKISFAPLKSLKSCEMKCHTARVHDGSHLVMLEWLVNCFLKAVVGILDWQKNARGGTCMLKAKS